MLDKLEAETQQPGRQVLLTNPPDGAISHDPLPLIIRTRTQEPSIPFIFQIPPLSSPCLHSLPFSRPPADSKLPREEGSLAIQLRSHGERLDRRHPDSYELHMGQEHRCCEQRKEAGPAGYDRDTQDFMSEIIPVDFESSSTHNAAIPIICPSADPP
jgi:hypothetical protein